MSSAKCLSTPWHDSGVFDFLKLQVAGFIFGGNKKEEKISMTSPVQSEYKQEEANGEKNGKGEKIAMTVPVTTLIEGGR